MRAESILCIRPRATAGSKSGEWAMAVASNPSIDMVSMLVSKLRLERFPRINVGTPMRYDWRYHFGQFLFRVVRRRGRDRGTPVTVPVLSELLSL
jgi:hypothetical protein